MTSKEIKSLLGIGLLTSCFVEGCSTNPPRETCGPTLSCTATQPDRQRLLAHFQQQVTYPATREQILAACAQTPEFAQGEKQWLADNLPQGSYTNADAVIHALKI